jgi:hypothetical protein
MEEKRVDIKVVKRKNLFALHFHVIYRLSDVIMNVLILKYNFSFDVCI